MKRYLFWQGNLLLSEQTAALIDLIRRCAECGISAVVVADAKLGLLDRYFYGNPLTTSGMKYSANWHDLRNAAAYRKIELIPLLNTYGPELIATEPELQEPGTESRPVACIGNRRTYKIWEFVIEKAQAFTQAKRCFLGFCELRHGGHHQACKGIPYGWAARQFQDVAGQYFEQTLIWGDMFDIHHNCQARYYDLYLPYRGAAGYLDPKQLVVPWRKDTAAASVAYFHRKNLPMIVSMDIDNVGDSRPTVNCTLEHLVNTWLSAAKGKRVEGAMFTTWKKNYALLEQWSELVAR